MLLPKPTASLSAGLLARKGEATPAVRRQGDAPRPALPERDRVAIHLPEPDVAAADARGTARHAFTLRLDDQRHIKLRLAVAARGRSAQQIVTEALDDFLATLPEVEALAAQLPPSDTYEYPGT